MNIFNNKKIMLVFAILAVAFAATNSYISFVKNSDISDMMSGYATDTGLVNVTVATYISVNFTYDTINWSVGTIDSGQSNASLNTIGPTVVRGNWSTGGVNPLILQNIGGINVSVSIKGDKNAATLFGGSAGHRLYMINVSNNETGSCNVTFSNSTWRDVVTAGDGELYCNQMGFLDTQDEFRIDVWLVIPYDGNVGNLYDTITATASTAV